MTQIEMYPTMDAAPASPTTRAARAARVVLVTVPLLVAWLAVAALHDLAAFMNIVRR